ncbi:hypothetical protein [Cognaticolwellia aestuarii]|nr:hypothetical protein [Cognaticolwellia aestuarii]
MLIFHPNCQCCDKDQGVCPNCQGDFMPRPTRQGDLLVKYPASTKRITQA